MPNGLGRRLQINRGIQEHEVGTTSSNTVDREMPGVRTPSPMSPATTRRARPAPGMLFGCHPNVAVCFLWNLVRMGNLSKIYIKQCSILGCWLIYGTICCYTILCLQLSQLGPCVWRAIFSSTPWAASGRKLLRKALLQRPSKHWRSVLRRTGGTMQTCATDHVAKFFPKYVKALN